MIIMQNLKEHKAYLSFRPGLPQVGHYSRENIDLYRRIHTLRLNRCWCHFAQLLLIFVARTKKTNDRVIITNIQRAEIRSDALVR